MSHKYLTSDEIDELVRIGAQYGFGADPIRADLFAFIHRDYYPGLTINNIPREQVRSDLIAMNQIARLAADNSVPLEKWLKDAILRLEYGDATHLRVYKRALEKVQEQITGRTAEENLQQGLPPALQQLYIILNRCGLHPNVLVSRYRWVDRYASDTIQTFGDLFETLQDRFERKHFWEIVSFVELIARHADVQEATKRQLHQWVDDLQRTHQLDPRMIQEARQRDYQGERARRLFQLEIEPDEENPQRSFILSIYPGNEGDASGALPKTDPFHREKLKENILDALKACPDLENTRLECFVPSGRLLPLIESIDQWEIEDGGFSLQLFEFGQVYLRSRERQRDKRSQKYVWPRWKKRWEQGRQQALTLATCQTELKQLQNSKDSHLLVLDAESDVTNAFIKQERNGVPIMLWGRHDQIHACDAFIEAFAAAANQVFASSGEEVLTVEMVRDCVHAIRENDPRTGVHSKVGKHIVLFWDDPYSGLPKPI